jgi:endonuclease/exonuclease/phosphatase family metal-dependent hydrolase
MLLAGALVLGGCSLSAEDVSPPGTLRVVAWNVQALFDGQQSGTEYDEYRTEAGWAEDKFSARVAAISQAIGGIEGGPPDVLALEELENLQCLEALAGGELARYGYGWTYFAKNRGAALGIGVLSRIPFTEARVHGMVWNRAEAPRPVLEVWLQPEDAPLALFICHWKSKLGGDDATETLRRASARIILRRIREIHATRPGVPAVIMGDLNENYDEFYRRGGSALSALLPDDPDAVELAGGPAGRENFLVLSGEKPPVSANFGSSTPAFYSPWGQELQQGSYLYRNEWETIDHFLLSEQCFDEKGWDFSSCRVLAQEPFVKAGGAPNAYNPRYGGGLSDHLPLLLVLTLR